MNAKTQKADQTENASTAWIPENPGDVLEGTVTDVDRAWSNFRAKNFPDGWYPLLTIIQDDGTESTFHAFRTVPYNEVVRRMPVPGERIVITYHGQGKKPTDGGNPAEIYRVKVIRDPAAAKDAARSLYGSLSNGGRAETDPPVQSDVPPDTEGLPPAQGSLGDEDIPF